MRYTMGFEQYVLSLSALNVSINAIAKLCGVCWDTVKDIQKDFWLK
ncbi:transposase family protein, partial [Vibrio sp. S457-15]